MYDTVIIDAMNLAYRSWWPVRELTTSDGVPTGLEFGFIKNLLAITREHIPAEIILAWDGRPTRGLQIFPEYKAGRDKGARDNEPSWIERLDLLRKLLAPMLLSLYNSDTEADEQIARYVKHNPDKNIIISSTDRDFHQLVSEKVTVVGTSGKIYDVDAVKEKWGVEPKKVLLFRAIEGEKSSDNFPGVPRISAVIKVRLASEATSLDHMIQLIDEGEFPGKSKERLQQGKDVIRRNYALADLWSQEEKPDEIQIPTGESTEVLKLCEKLELKSLLERKEWRLFQKEAVASE